MNPIKILNITPTGAIGGRERQLYLLSRSLSNDTEVTFDMYFIRGEGPFYDESLLLPIRTLKRPYPKWDPRSFFFTLELFKQYDILNFWGLDFYTFLTALLVGNKKVFCLQGARGIVKKTFYDVWMIFFRKIGLGGSSRTPSMPANGAPPIRDFKINVRSIRRIIRKELLIMVLEKCFAVIAPSQYLKDLCMNYYGLPGQKVAIVHNGVDFNDLPVTKTKETVFREFGLSTDTFLIGVAARFDVRKRLDRLIRAMSYLPASMNIKAIVYGGGSDEVKNDLIGLMEKLKVQDKVLLPGFRSDVYNYVKALDLFVLPSDSEGLSLAIIESIYLRVPTVVFEDGGGVLEVIKHNQTGYVVSDEVKLAELIQAIYHDRRSTQIVVNGGFEFVLNNFSIQKVAQNYKSILTDWHQ